MIRFRPLPFRFRTAAIGALLPCLAPHLHAQTTRTTTTRTTRTLQSTAETEVARRQSLALSADDNLRQGDAAMVREDYEDAVRFYRTATDSLTDSPATGDKRKVAMKKFFNASLKLAELRIVEGRYPDAETVVKVTLRPEYDPNYEPSIELLEHLEDPEYYNQTVGPKHIAKVQLVKKYLLEGSQYYDTGRYDLAFKRYEQVLSLDPYNDAARRGEEKVDLAKTRHAETTGYQETRGRLIAETATGWELPVRHSNLDADPRRNYQKINENSGTVAITRKLQSIIIPNIEFRQTTLNDAVEFLRQEARRLDTQSPEDERGINIFLKLPSSGPRAAAPAAPTEAGIPGLPAGAEGGAPAPSTASLPPASVPTGSTRISLTLSRIPLLSALDYVAKAANLKIKVEPYAVSIVPLTEETGDMITLEVRVPPSFIASTSTGGVSSALNQGATSATGGGAGGTTDVTGTGSGALTTRADAKTFLESSGVTFPPGASAVYLASTSKLVVRNTQANIDLVQALVAESIQVPKQVEIESKFINITQTNLKELGFDWTLGQFNIDSGEKTFASGGTDGAGGVSTTAADFPFNNNSTAVGTNPVTSGNRSGTYGISANAIDALLLGTGAAAVAPGIFSIAGVFSDPQFQVVIRALNQQKGVDLLSAPRVTAKSGQKATIEIIREFIYPTQFQPPQIPQTIGATTGVSLTGATGGGSSNGSFPVTPTTPTAFEKRNTGVTLEVDPVIGPDNFTIDLTLQPQVVDFDGFINYGSPIQTVSTNALGISTTNVLTQNTINQPVFSVRKVSTSVSVYDGSTVVLGGLVREDIQKVNDKVPILGDIPVLGRLFRSKIDQNIKNNLIIFVTARLIDPSGQPLLNTTEEEEETAPLSGPDTYVQPPGPLPNYYKK